jgi:nucleoid-associated protein YgaU
MIAERMWKVVSLFLALAILAAAAPGASVAGMEGKAGEVITHEVAKGDNLYLIAGYYYRDPRQWNRVLDLNSDMVSDPDVIVPGMLLKIEADPGKQWHIPYGEFLSRIFD